MHTAICSFEHRDVAERARDRLLQAGFDRDDVHLQHRGPTDAGGRSEDPRAWEGTDHEVAVSREMVDKVAGFFVHLFGADRNPDQQQVYEKAVDSGCTLLVVDTADEAEAARARALLHDLQAADLNVYHRPAQRPLREYAAGADRPLPGSSGGLQGSYQDRGSAFDAPPPGAERAATGGARGEGLAASSVRGGTGSPGAEADRERAVASRQEDLDHVGLRYADKDKPGG